MPSTNLTIGIPCKDRPIELAILLQSLLEQSTRTFDILLVNDSLQDPYLEANSINPTIKGLLTLHANSGNHARIIQNTERGKGPHAVGDIILNASETEYILRLDDDVTLTPGFVDLLLNVIESDPKIAACGGIWLSPYLSMKQQTLPEDLSEDVIKEAVKVKEENGALVFNSHLQWALHKPNTAPISTEHLNSGFMYRKSVGLEIGGYPKDLSVVGHNEETDFSYRMFRAHYSLYIVPDAIGFHYHPSYGGIRETMENGMIVETSPSLWESDARKFQKRGLELLKGEQKTETVNEEVSKYYPLLNIILLTHAENDPSEVLDSIFSYTEPPYRVLIVNNDEKRFAQDLSFTPNNVEVSVIHTDKRLPVSVARNIGAKNAADYFCFLDDDARILFKFPDWLRKLYDIFISVPDVGAVGPVVTTEPDTQYQVCSACCLFTSKKVFEVVGGFDPVFGRLHTDAENIAKPAWGYEDTDWSIRCYQAGFKILPVSGTFPFYHEDPDLSVDKSASRKEAKDRARELFLSKWGVK